MSRSVLLRLPSGRLGPGADASSCPTPSPTQPRPSQNFSIRPFASPFAPSAQAPHQSSSPPAILVPASDEPFADKYAQVEDSGYGMSGLDWEDGELGDAEEEEEEDELVQQLSQALKGKSRKGVKKVLEMLGQHVETEGVAEGGDEVEQSRDGGEVRLFGSFSVAHLPLTYSPDRTAYREAPTPPLGLARPPHLRLQRPCRAPLPFPRRSRSSGAEQAIAHRLIPSSHGSRWPTRLGVEAPQEEERRRQRRQGREQRGSLAVGPARWREEARRQEESEWSYSRRG